MTTDNKPLLEIENDTPVKQKAQPVVKLPRKKAFYLTNADLLKEVIHAKELGRITEKLAKMFILLTERYSRKSNFAGYSFREDMVSTALINLCANGLKFNPEKSSNPFAFYTTAIHNSFLQYMADEKKHRNIRDALIVDAGSNPSFTYLEDGKSDNRMADADSGSKDPLIAGTDLVTGRINRIDRQSGEVTITSYVTKELDEDGNEIQPVEEDEFANYQADPEVLKAVLSESLLEPKVLIDF